MFTLVFVGELLDVFIRGLGPLGEHHMDVVVIHHLSHSAVLHLVGIEDHDNPVLLQSLIAAEGIQEPDAGQIHILLGQLLQLRPGVDHVVAVHQEEMCIRDREGHRR